MKRTTILLLLATTLVVGTIRAETKDELIAGIRRLNAEQKQQIEDARSRLTWTWNELNNAQAQIAQVALERDQWQTFGEDQKRQKEVAQKDLAHVLGKYHTLKWIASIIAAAGAVMLILQFPIPIPYKWYAMAGAGIAATGAVWAFL